MVHRSPALLSFTRFGVAPRRHDHPNPRPGPFRRIGLRRSRSRGNIRSVIYTPTTVTRPSRASKSAGFRVYSGSCSEHATAAISRSTARAPRELSGPPPAQRRRSGRTHERPSCRMAGDRTPPRPAGGDLDVEPARLASALACGPAASSAIVNAVTATCFGSCPASICSRSMTTEVSRIPIGSCSSGTWIDALIGDVVEIIAELCGVDHRSIAEGVHHGGTAARRPDQDLVRVGDPLRRIGPRRCRTKLAVNSSIDGADAGGVRGGGSGGAERRWRRGRGRSRCQRRVGDAACRARRVAG